MIWMAAGVALLGVALAWIPSLLPGFHIYGLIAPMALAAYAMPGLAAGNPDIVVPLVAGMVTAWSVLNTIPSVLLATPDESALFTVLPGQRYLMNGQGYEGVLVIGAGSLAGLFLLVFGGGLLAPRCLPVIQKVLSPHFHSIVWLIIAFMLMSEWPRGGDRGPDRMGRFLDAWSTLIAGLCTFLLSGGLGFVLLYRAPVAVGNAFQNLFPAFAGLFAVPCCLLNALGGTSIPEQKTTRSIGLPGRLLATGAVTGFCGGALAAFLPAVTGGTGGMLAGHAAAQRDRRAFMVSQGAAKSVYYAGALLLFFVPGIRMTRGGAAWMLQGAYTPDQPGVWFLALGSIALSGAAAFLLLGPAAMLVLRLIRRVDGRRVSVVSLLMIAVMVGWMTGIPGLFIAIVSTGIGLLPVVFGSRRLNCLGILLLPVACNLSGIGPAVAAWLGLLR